MILSPLVRSSLHILKLPSQSVNMKALILLCLLYFAFGQDSFMWSLHDSQDASRECRKDQGSCGCCKMLSEVESMRNYTDWKLGDLEKEYQRTNESFNTLKNSRTAFSAAMADDDFQGCTGPYGVEKLIKYNHVFIDLNDSYNQTTGVFTVPHSGVYSITFTVYSDSGTKGSEVAVCAVLVVNSQPIARATDINKDDQEDQSAHVIALQLQKGDSVAVRLPVGCFLCDEKSRYNTFSIFLLHSTE